MAQRIITYIAIGLLLTTIVGLSGAPNWFNSAFGMIAYLLLPVSEVSLRSLLKRETVKEEQPKEIGLICYDFADFFSFIQNMKSMISMTRNEDGTITVVHKNKEKTRYTYLYEDWHLYFKQFDGFCTTNKAHENPQCLKIVQNRVNHLRLKDHDTTNQKAK